MRICVISNYVSKASQKPTSNLIDILRSFSNPIYIIRKESISSHTDSPKKTFIAIALSYIHRQLECSWKVMRIARNVDIYVFFIGGTTSFLPMLVAKLLRKKVVLSTTGSVVKTSIGAKDPLILTLLIKISEEISHGLSDKIILYSRNIKESNLEKYRNKISIAHRHFLDFDKFEIKKSFDERDNLVGYIGRLSGEKGVLNFVKAVPKILEKRSKINFLIGGDGQLRDEIEEYLDEENLNNKVELAGWIPHDELPDYLNTLKLVVLPAYTEGLPNIMLEAMACGTPVLATPVGGVPDVIKEGETGFILENNSPECIAKNVIKVLEYPNLDKIVKNARELVEREFTYLSAVERYKDIISKATLK